jgi:hypothetical protein
MAFPKHDLTNGNDKSRGEQKIIFINALVKVHKLKALSFVQTMILLRRPNK